MTYQIITDATADLNEELLAGLPEVKIIPMNVEVGGKEYLCGPGGNIECDEFYGYLRGGQFASTSQINPEVYRDRFEAILKQNMDVLYLCFSSGLSSTIQSARMAIEELRDMVAVRFPDAEIYIAPIGPVIGAHAGPGVMTVFFWGNNH